MGGRDRCELKAETTAGRRASDRGLSRGADDGRYHEQTEAYSMQTVKLRGFSERRTIDATPSWVDVLPVLRIALEHGNSQSRADAVAELYRMARLADVAVKYHKKWGSDNEPV
jgi:hypothetical protein